MGEGKNKVATKFGNVATSIYFSFLKCSYMAKSKQIGVRFDEEILEQIKFEHNLTSPQKVLNYLMENYRSCVLNTEKGVTIINPKNGFIIKDFPNPQKPIVPRETILRQYPLEEKDMIAEVDNSEIEKQITAIKNEVKPSWIDKSKFERYQEKKINELRLKMK